MVCITEVAEKVSLLLKTDFELTAGECLVKKKRMIEIYAGKNRFHCMLDLDISFNAFEQNGFASNKAEIYLLPEELPAFTFTLKEYIIPLPLNTEQRLTANPNIICFQIVCKEPPEHFAERLSAAFQVINQ